VWCKSTFILQSLVTVSRLCVSQVVGIDAQEHIYTSATGSAFLEARKFKYQALLHVHTQLQ
jgi:hypothetical protein